MIETTYSLPVIESIKAAWGKINGAKGTIWTVFAMFFVPIVIGIILPTHFYPLTIIVYIVEFLLGIALTYVGIQRAQGAPIHYKMIKEVMTFRIFFCTVGYYLLQLVVLIPAILLIVCGSALLAYGQQHTPSTSLNLFAFILYFAAAILLLFLIVRMWLGLGFIVDKKQNPWEALKSTFAATTGNVWNLLGLAILVCLILAASIITLYIGMIWGMPWIVIIYGEVYKRLGLRT